MSWSNKFYGAGARLSSKFRSTYEIFQNCKYHFGNYIIILTSYSYVFHFYLQSNASILAWSIFKKLIFKWKEDIKVIMALLIDIIWDYQTIINNVTDSKIPFTPLISTFYWRKTKGTWVIYCIDHLWVSSLKDNNFPFNLQKYKLSYSTNFSGRPPDKIYMWVLWKTII